MKSNRPICVHCGGSYGSRYTSMETIKWADGEPKPEYRGNGIVVKERIWTTGASRGSSHGVVYGHNETIAHRTIWDGESWAGGYDPFCTLRCALDYARKAYSKWRQL